MNDVKVYGAALFGFSVPGMILFFENVEPLLKALVLLGQAGVAAATVLYILAKIKHLRNSDKNDE